MPELTITQIYLIIGGIIATGLLIVLATNFYGGALKNIFSSIGLLMGLHG
ncbi:MAG: hypothetical protein HY517_02905 [Candidatus Aenigmarchaeota archaeon]|nr:hypothetical protein [Candidatus Aenigmarchaeota archaeon]